MIVDRGFPGSSLVQVMSDHYAGAVVATQRLIASGHREIGVLQGLPGTVTNEERIAGVRDVLAEHSLAFDPTLVAGDNFSEPSGYHSTRELLSRHPEITAFFAFSTPNAMGALRALHEMGCRGPEDLSIVAFDDAPFADLMQVPLTTVSQDVRQLGRTAATLMKEHLRGKSMSKNRTHRIAVEPIERKSIRSR